MKRFLTAAALGFALVAAAAVSPLQARVTGSDAQTVDRIADHFTSVPTMAGEFMQFGPTGEQTSGKFYLSRPGKIRFDYADPAALTVQSDGRTVGVNNRKLKTWDFYPLRTTPLKLLLDEKIESSNAAIKSVKQEADLTTVVMADESVFGNSKITLMFDPETFDLRQWTITDAQGKDTSVMIFNVQENVKLSKRLFQMDKTRGRTNPGGRNQGK